VLGPGKHNSKALIVIAIVIVAAVAGAYYYTSIPHAPAQFMMVVNPPFFHSSPGGGAQLLVQVSRMPGYNGGVNVSVVNPPAWVTVNPIEINSTSVNGTLTVLFSNQAQFGSYELYVMGTAAAGPSQTVMVAMKVVSVRPVASPYGTAAVYETTKTLDSETLASLVSFTNGTLQFSKDTPQLDNLDRGDVLVAPPHATGVVPKGFLLTVLDVQKENGVVLVDTRLAALVEVFKELHFGHSMANTASSSSGDGTSTTALRMAPTDDVTDLCASQISCWTLFNTQLGTNDSLGGDAKLGATLTLKGYLYAYGDISCCVSVDFGLLFLGHEEAFAGLSGSAGTQLNWSDDDIMQIVPPVTIQIFPGLLWIDIDLNLAGHASGTLKEDVNANIDQYFNLIAGPTFDGGLPSSLQSLCNTSGSGFDFCHYHDFQPPTPNLNIGLPTIGGDLWPQGGQPDWPVVAIGPSLSGDVDDVAGVTFDAFAYLLLNTGIMPAEIPSWSCEPTYCPVWVLYFGIGASLDFWINIQVWQAWYKITWPRLFQWEIAHAKDYPPSTPILSYWTDMGGFNLTTTSKPYVDLTAFMPEYGASYSCNSSGTSCTEGSGISSYTPDPEGENVTCIWMTKEVGEIGQTPTFNDHDASLPGSTCAPPPLTKWPKDKIASMIGNDLNQLTVTVVAAAPEIQSATSNAVSVPVILPTPMLSIMPINFVIVQNQYFPVQGSVTISSPLLPGLIPTDLCQTESQNIEWFVGGSFEANIVDVGEGGWVNAQSTGSGCNPTLTATSSGQTTVYMVLLSIDPQTGNQYIAQAVNDSPLNIASVMINVQPQPTTQPTTPPPGPSSLHVGITSPTPSEYSGTPPVSPASGPIQLNGLVTGGTSPYTVTWYAQYSSQTVTIVTGGSNDLNYAWTVCNSFYNEEGMASVYLKATDSSNNEGGPAGPIYVNFMCEVAQALPPFSVAVVSLLTVLFAVTGEQIVVKVRNVPWVRGVDFRSH